MARVATCPHCRRVIGLLAEKATPYSKPRPPRLIAHASTDTSPPVGGKRPRCRPNQPTYQPRPEEIREVQGRPSSRRRHTAVVPA